MTFEARPHHLFSARYDLSSGDRPVCTLELEWFRSRGRFSLDGREYRVLARGWTSGAFTLETEDRELASAERSSFLPLGYRVRVEDRWLELRAPGLSRRFTVLHGDRPVGSIRPRQLFSRVAVVEGADAVPLPVRVFLLAVVLLRWRRRARASAGG